MDNAVGLRSWCGRAAFDLGNSGMRTSVTEVLKTTSPTTAELIVSLPTGEQLADIRLVGRAYSPSDFQVSGATILYHPT